MKKIMVALVVGLLAGALLGTQQMMSLTPEMEKQVITQLGSKQMVFILFIVQTTVMTCIATMIGAWAAPKVNLDRPFIYHRKNVLMAVGIGLLSASFIAISEKLVFAEALGLQTEYQFSLLYFLSSIVYGGIVEEVLVRFGLMSLLIWGLSKITKRTASSGIYIVGILVTALLFAGGHLPATAQMFGLSTVSVARALLLNFIPGVGFGFLYWRYGLVYAMLGHVTTHIFNQLVLLPILF